jgi:site-specific DNA-cytosine methylase
LGGIDSDPAVCRDFRELTGVDQLCANLFTRDQYRQFYGAEPPNGWQEITIEQIQQAAQHRIPDVVFISAPCKGYSRLLSPKRASTLRYEALNQLVLRCVHLAMAAWGNGPKLYLIENVPAIQQRGRDLLDRVHRLFQQAGYAVRETTHCAGELGGLGQRRKRFLMVARQISTVTTSLYEPPKKRLKTIGEVLATLPRPNSVEGGPLHRLPRLTPITWLRLALIPAGKDWRALQGVDLRKVRIGWRGQETDAETWLRAMQGDDAACMALCGQWGDYKAYGVRSGTESSGTITGQAAPGTGAFSIADSRWFPTVLGILSTDSASGAITGRANVSTGAYGIADKTPRFNNVYRVLGAKEPSVCITGGSTPGAGGVSVADPRPWDNAGHYGVLHWTDTAPCITGSASVDNGRSSVADPDPLSNVPVIISEDGCWHRPLTILEMAALQGFDVAGLTLDGSNRAKWQERIGNAIPPPTAEAIGNAMLRTMLMSQLGMAFALSSTDVWVKREQQADQSLQLFYDEPPPRSPDNG